MTTWPPIMTTLPPKRLTCRSSEGDFGCNIVKKPVCCQRELRFLVEEASECCSTADQIMCVFILYFVLNGQVPQNAYNVPILTKCIDQTFIINMFTYKDHS